MIEDETQNLSQQLIPPYTHQKSTVNCNYVKVMPQKPTWQRKKKLVRNYHNNVYLFHVRGSIIITLLLFV